MTGRHGSAPVEGDANHSEARRAWVRDPEQVRDPEMVARDAGVFYHQVLSSPCLDGIVAARGPWIERADGTRLLDMHGNSVHQIGHAHPAVVGAVCAQLDRLAFCPRRFTNEAAVELAERLVRLAPGELRDRARVLLAPSGAVAVGIALKIARAVTGRVGTIAFEGAFHGATIETGAVGGQELFTRGMGGSFGEPLHVPPPDPSSCEHGCGGDCSSACAGEIERILAAGKTAAVITEPIRATVVRHMSNQFWARIRAACDRTGTLLIFDEIPTGLGRAGVMFSTELTGVTPDLVVLGKGLGGGAFPQAAVIGRAEFNHTGAVAVRELAIGHYTHEKSPVGAAAARATLDVIQAEGLVDRAEEIGTRWRDQLAERLLQTGVVREIRQTGLMVAVEISASCAAQVADHALYESLRRGLSYKIGGVRSLVLFPPLNIEQRLLDRATTILDESIRCAARTLGVGHAG